ncbi:MAG: hypothetical protein V3W11_10545 [bacterium]
MRFAASLLHGLALAAINVAAVLVGFALYKISGVAYQLAVQVPVAVLISVGGFALWYVAARRLGGEWFRLRGLSGYVWTYVLALAWLPALFAPLHYVTQGYLTSFANIYYTWLFQAPTNVAALAAASLFGRCSTT